MDKVGQRLYQFLSQSRLQRGERSKQLDDLDQHPVVGGAGHQLEEGGGEGEIVLWVFPRQLTDDIDCSRLDARVRIFQLLLKPWKSWPQCFGVSQEHLFIQTVSNRDATGSILYSLCRATELLFS